MSSSRLVTHARRGPWRRNEPRDASRLCAGRPFRSCSATHPNHQSAELGGKSRFVRILHGTNVISRPTVWEICFPRGQRAACLSPHWSFPNCLGHGWTRRYRSVCPTGLGSPMVSEISQLTTLWDGEPHRGRALGFTCCDEPNLGLALEARNSNPGKIHKHEMLPNLRTKDRGKFNPGFPAAALPLCRLRPSSSAAVPLIT